MIVLSVITLAILLLGSAAQSQGASKAKITDHCPFWLRGPDGKSYAYFMTAKREKEDKPDHLHVEICGRGGECVAVATGVLERPVAIMWKSPATLVIYDKYKGPIVETGLYLENKSPIVVEIVDISGLPAEGKSPFDDPNILSFDVRGVCHVIPPITSSSARYLTEFP